MAMETKMDRSSGLVLKRRKNERVYLLREGDSPIVVGVNGVVGNSARLSFCAPDNVKILREEVLGGNFPRIYDKLLKGAYVTKEMLSEIEVNA
jgi:sRNA-binding carbon storage regulator CsrA